MKSERERQIPHGITYIENLKYNEHIYIIKQVHKHRQNRLTDRENMLMVAKGEREGLGG